MLVSGYKNKMNKIELNIDLMNGKRQRKCE
jgi:hypothetical protein